MFARINNERSKRRKKKRRKDETMIVHPALLEVLRDSR